jgi:hypothetical protein
MLNLYIDVTAFRNKSQDLGSIIYIMLKKFLAQSLCKLSITNINWGNLQKQLQFKKESRLITRPPT